MEIERDSINFMEHHLDEGMKEVLVYTLAARGLEERRIFKELLTESVGRVHFP